MTFHRQPSFTGEGRVEGRVRMVVCVGVLVLDHGLGAAWWKAR